MRVAVLGASRKPERYANMAIRLLMEHGHEVLPVTPAHRRVEGLPAHATLADLEPGSVDTVTVYMNPERSTLQKEVLLALHPRRVIFNPGAENKPLQRSLNEAGIDVEEACTLVLLRTGAF